MSFYKAIPVKSPQKDRRCEWCGEWAPAGVPAIRVAAVFDGDFTTYTLHPECSEAWKRTCAQDCCANEFSSYANQRGMAWGEEA